MQTALSARNQLHNRSFIGNTASLRLCRGHVPTILNTRVRNFSLLEVLFVDLVYTARPSCQIRWTSPVRIYIHHLHESIRHALSSSGLFQTIEVLCAAASCCGFHHVRLRVLVLALSFSAHLFIFPFTCPSLCLSPSLSLSLFVSVPPSVHPTSLDASLLFCLPPVLLLSFLLSLLHACSATPIHSSTARSSCPCAVLSLTYLARPGTLFVSLRRGSAAEFVPPPVSMCGLYIFLQVARIWKTLRMHKELSSISYFFWSSLPFWSCRHPPTPGGVVG